MEVQLSISLLVLYQHHNTNSDFLICTYCHISTVIYNFQNTSNVVLKSTCLHRK